MLDVLKRVFPRPPAPPSTRDVPLSGAREVNQAFARVGENLGADGHLQQEIRGIRAGALPTSAVDASLGTVVLAITEVDERVGRPDSLGFDAATTAAVAAVGTPVLDVLLTPKTHASVAAVAGTDKDLCLIKETAHGGRTPPSR